MKYQNQHVRRISYLIRQLDAMMALGGDPAHVPALVRDLRKAVEDLSWQCLGEHLELYELTQDTWDAFRNVSSGSESVN